MNCASIARDLRDIPLINRSRIVQYRKDIFALILSKGLFTAASNILVLYKLLLQQFKVESHFFDLVLHVTVFLRHLDQVRRISFASTLVADLF